MCLNGHEDTEANQQSDHGCASITDQWQRYANDRQQPGHHSRIDEHINKESQAQTSGQQPRIGVARPQRDYQTAGDQPRVHAEQGKDAVEAELFSYDRQNEVRVPLREELQV